MRLEISEQKERQIDAFRQVYLVSDAPPCDLAAVGPNEKRTVRYKPVATRSLRRDSGSLFNNGTDTLDVMMSCPFFNIRRISFHIWSVAGKASYGKE